MDISDATPPQHDDEGISGDSGFYADDVPFRSGVVVEQAPLRMAYVAALNGFDPPRPEGRFRYCDLGCGDGTTLNALASVYPEAEFFGIDFNERHIADARDTAATAGLENVRYVQASFTEAARHDLPAFDFIGMNGIYAWLDKDVLPSVHAFLADHLRPGGLFAVEYLCMPGMIAIVPMWHLVQALVPSDGGSSHERATRALRVLEELAGGGMAYLAKHETARRAVASYVRRWRSKPAWIDHFAHNALASGFRPRFFNEMSEEMAAAGLGFAGRLDVALNDPELCVPLKQLSLLRGIEDRPTRELLMDFIRNERNRRDLFVMRGEPDPAAARDFLLNEVRFLARTPAGAAAPSLSLPGGRRVPLTGPGYDSLIAGFEGAACALREIELPEPVSDDTLITAAFRLFATGRYFLCGDTVDVISGPDIPAQVEMPMAINRRLLDMAIESIATPHLMAEATGGPAIQLGPLEAVIIKGWMKVGYGEAAAEARANLAGRHETVRINGAERPLSSLSERQLVRVRDQLESVKIRNMLRLGILKAVA